MGADAAQDAGKGAALQDHRQGLGHLPFLKEADLLPHPDVQGAGRLAGRQLLADALRQDLVGPVEGWGLILGHEL